MARAEKRVIRIDFIQPGNPQQNAYVDRYKRTVRYDRLTLAMSGEVGDDSRRSAPVTN